MLLADGVEVVLAASAAHVMQELPVHIDAEADEVEELFYVIDVAEFVALSMAGGDKQVFDIVAYVGEGGTENRLLGEMLT